MLAKLREMESFLRGRCQCCGGKKRNSSWYCAKCSKSITRSVKRSMKK